MSLMPGSEDVRPGWDASAAARHNTPRVKLTYDDYVLFPEDGQRHELIDGEHYVSPCPNLRHQDIIGRLHLFIGGWLQQHRVGRAYIPRLDIVLSMFDVVEPDLLFVSNERAAILTTANVKGAPDLVVEVESPATRQRDLTIKRRLYERSNVTEYWIVDPEVDVIRVYRRAGDRFAKPIELSRENGDVLTTPLFPGLVIPLASVFED
jgi:Uma2 family endonuclease